MSEDMEPEELRKSLLIGRPLKDVFTDYSDSDEIMHQLYEEESQDLPRNFLDIAEPREPENIVAVRGKTAKFKIRSWKESVELSDEEFHQQEYGDLPDGEVTVEEFLDLLEKEQLGIISHDFGECSECEGKTTVECETCHGDSWIECKSCAGDPITDCDKCGGVGAYDCADCDGDGEIRCEDCSGSGELQCTHCSGSGELVKKEDCPNCSNGTIKTEETCSQCQGSGEILKDGNTVSCPRCTDGWFAKSGVVAVENTCPQCGGAGTSKRRITCSSCGGVGTQTCSRCDETGTYTCSVCGGTGSDECDQCTGSGTVTCEVCGGEGGSECSDCSNGIVDCPVCDASGEAHSIVVKHQKIVTEESKISMGRIPHSVDDPEWSSVEPGVIDFGCEETESIVPGDTIRYAETVDIHTDERDRYKLFTTRYVGFRVVTYDYGDKNFTVRETPTGLSYSRLPKPLSEQTTSLDTPGIIESLKNIF